MAIKKPEKSVSGMDVLKDIRGLLSTNREPEVSVKPEAAKETGISGAEKAGFEKQISDLKAQIKVQQEETAKAKTENSKLESHITELKTQVKTLQDELAKVKKEKDESASKQKTAKAAGISEAEKGKFETQIKDLQKQLQEQQQALAKMKAEREELTGKLKTMSAVSEKPAQLALQPVKNDETVMLEARIADLTSTMEQVDGLLKSKSQELMKRIARVFSEAGQSDVAIEFRKGADGLENAENFARFLEILME